MSNNTKPTSKKDWERLALSEQLERSYCESIIDKLKTKVCKLEGELQDLHIDLVRKDRIIDVQQSVINDCK